MRVSNVREVIQTIDSFRQSCVDSKLIKESDLLLLDLIRKSFLLENTRLPKKVHNSIEFLNGFDDINSYEFINIIFNWYDSHSMELGVYMDEREVNWCVVNMGGDVEEDTVWSFDDEDIGDIVLRRLNSC